MNHEFCMNCGAKNLFQVTRPKFCCGCGLPLNSSLASTASHKKVSRQDDQEEERELDIDSLNIDALRRQISIESFGAKTTLDDLWSSPSPSSNRIGRPAYSGADASNILKKVQNECSPVVHSREVGE